MATGHKTGGRKKGVPNKATADVKRLAGKYSPKAMKTLADILDNSESDPARVAAAKEILDRAHGKAAMAKEDAETLTNHGTLLAAAWARMRPADAA